MATLGQGAADFRSNHERPIRAGSSMVEGVVIITAVNVDDLATLGSPCALASVAQTNDIDAIDSREITDDGMAHGSRLSSQAFQLRQTLLGQQTAASQMLVDKDPHG